MKIALEVSHPRIVLVHGLFMGRHAMFMLSRRLQREGFQVRCFAYNTVTGTLDASVAKLAAFLKEDGRSTALVGHSLGGLVSLQAAQSLPDGLLTALVLLGSPYQGAQAGRALKSRIGRAGARIARALHGWAELEQKPTVTVPVFTLSGTQSAGLGRLLCQFEEPNDGTVTLAETHYPGATACAMPVSHTGMLFSAPVAHQVAAWLRAVLLTLAGNACVGESALAYSVQLTDVRGTESGAVADVRKPRRNESRGA